MNQLLYIRTKVFDVKQTEFARIVGVGQASVSRWEHGESFPDLRDMKAIRDAATARNIEWNDEWFFAPQEVAA